MSLDPQLRRTFKGGVRPEDRKAYTKQHKIEDMPAPKTLVCPVRQHAGSPSEPVVRVGDGVKVGQLIAKQSGFVSANHHAPVSGRVTAIEPRLHPNGSMVTSIIIENDEKYEVFETISPNKPIGELTPRELLQIISDAGIVGMGGAAFPTHVKLGIPDGKSVDTVIVNGAECEPYLTSDYRVMLEDAEALLTGCAALIKIVGAKRCVIAVEDNKTDAAMVISEHILLHKYGIQVAVVETKYPQGSEKQLISVVTGREVPPVVCLRTWAQWW